jgi:hypothetical protein
MSGQAVAFGARAAGSPRTLLRPTCVFALFSHDATGIAGVFVYHAA